MSLPSKREFLVTAGLANPTRGRFSAEAEAFAAANAGKWAEAVKPAPSRVKVARDKVVTPTGTRVALPKGHTSGLDGKAVRAWAKQNGFEVGQRGRLPVEVISAYVKANGRPVGRAAARPQAVTLPKVRRESTGYSVVGGTLIRQDSCGKCAAQVSRCACPTGPRARGFIEKDAGGPVVLTLDKPAL